MADRCHLLMDTKVDDLYASVFFVKKVEVRGLLCWEGYVLESARSGVESSGLELRYVTWSGLHAPCWVILENEP